MLLVPHVLVGLLGLLEGEDLLVDNGVNVVGLNGAVHVLKLVAAADQEAADGGDAAQDLQEAGLLVAGAGEEANDADEAVDADGLERLLCGERAADFDDMVDTAAAGQLLRGLSPVGVFLVVDDVVGTDGLELVGLGLGGGGCNDLGTSCLCELF